jgi:hypothetical protein
MTISGGENIAFERCAFNDNQQFELVEIDGTRNISFTNCEFRDNRGSSMFAVHGTTVSVSNSSFIGNETDSSIRASDNVAFTGCTFGGVNVETVPPSSEGNNAAAGTANRIIKVSNAREFLEALGSDRIIEAPQGSGLNLSEWDPYLTSAGKELKLAKGVSWEEVYDGGRLNLEGIKNLTIRGGTEPGSISQISVAPRYAEVLNFVNCSGIVIEELTAGHSESVEECGAGVFSFTDSSRITITGSYMYGCGTYGLSLQTVFDMKVADSQIYNCTQGIMLVYGGDNIAFDRCVFSDNKGFGLVGVMDTPNISFTDCKFTGNSGNMFGVADTVVSVSNATFRDNETDSPIRDSENVAFTNCVFD